MAEKMAYTSKWDVIKSIENGIGILGSFSLTARAKTDSKTKELEATIYTIDRFDADVHRKKWSTPEEIFRNIMTITSGIAGDIVQRTKGNPDFPPGGRPFIVKSEETFHRR